MPWETVQGCVGCGCGTPSTGPCCCQGPSSIGTRFWRFEMQGITDGTCQFCGDLNGEFILDSFDNVIVGACNWYTCGRFARTCGSDPSFLPQAWTLKSREGFPPGRVLVPINALPGTFPRYFIPGEQWNCNGENTLTLEGSSQLCSSFPLSVRLEPLGGPMDTCILCDWCTPRPRQYAVEVGGFGNSGCQNCEVLNGTHILTLSENSCLYQSEPLELRCSFGTGGLIQLNPDFDYIAGGPCYVTVAVLMGARGSNRIYRLPRANMNCNGSTVFPFYRETAIGDGCFGGGPSVRVFPV